MKAGDKGVERGPRTHPWNFQLGKPNGKKKKFPTPQDLLDAINGYFEWVRENPLYEPKLVFVEGQHKLIDVPKLRAMTVGGLCTHLGLTANGWHQYKKRKEYADICEMTLNIIRTQKFEGAAADIFNTQLITRDLGLVERQQHAGDPDAPPIVQIVRYGSQKD